MTTALEVLMLEDNTFDSELIQGALRSSDLRANVRLVTDQAGFREELGHPCDVILTDYNLPGFTILDAIGMAQELAPEVPIIVVTGSVGDEAAAACIKHGASDYVLKDGLARLPKAIRSSIEHRGLRNELRASEARFRSLVQNSRNVIVVVDEAGICSYVSPSILSVGGYTPEDLIGTSAYRLVHPDDLASFQSHLSEILKAPDDTQTVEVRALTKAGEHLWMEVRAVNRLQDPLVRGLVLNCQDITERRTAADQIAASQRSMAEAQAISHFGSFSRDLRTDAHSWSDEQFRLLGFAPGDIHPTFETFLACIHPDDRGRIERMCAATIESGKAFQADYRVVLPKGAIRWIHGRAKVSFEDGVPVRFAGINQDVTAAKEAEEERAALLAQQKKLTDQFRLLLDSTGEGIFGVDRDGVCTFINRAGATLLGGTAARFVGKIMYQLTGPRQVNEVGVVMEDHATYGAFQTGASSKLADEAFTRSDGSSFPVEYSSFPITGGGEAQGAVVAFKDITDRRQMEQELRQSEQLFRGAFDVARTGIALIDADGRSYVDVNQSLCDMVGYTKEELMALDWVEITHPDDRAINIAAVAEFFAGRKEVSYIKKRYVRKDGAVISVEISDSLVRGPDDKPMYFVTHVADVTEREQAGKEKEKLEEQLRQAQKMEAVGQLAGGVAHDFNNILAVVLNYAEFVADTLGEDHEGQADLEQIIKAGERGAELVHQLLAFSRQEVIQPTVIDLNEVVSGMAVLLDRSVGEDIELTFDTPPGVSLTKADHGQLEQILLNLVVNARDSMPDGGAIKITTADEEIGSDERAGLAAGPYVCLTVSDTGLGIDAATIEHIFEPFFTTKARGEGTGLGLATVYGIVQRAQGGIFAESEVGKRTSFVIYLPVTNETAPISIDQIATEEVEVGTILVVEDEAPVRELIGRILKREGFDVIAAASGAEALEICAVRDLGIDLLLTDVVMPQMSGPALRDLVHPLRPEMKVLFMSGYTDELIAKRGVLAEGETLLSKPFNSTQLLTGVREALRSEATV
ncbi:MAG: hypothetical protein QOG04_1468 [Actinomycetota bacterium]|nr:hypothetical protein [Actinomycetota bacterium]